MDLLKHFHRRGSETTEIALSTRRCLGVLCATTSQLLVFLETSLRPLRWKKAFNRGGRRGAQRALVVAFGRAALLR